MGVIGLVQFSDAPCAIADEVIHIIRAREVGGVVDVTPSGLKKGDVVCLREGAFTDHTALLEEISDEKRVVLLLDLMGREVRVTASVESLAKVS